ncbi:MAG: hypothetical protein ACHQ0J_07885 [Candidatus Dormibacterales bacterium]
MNSSIRWRIITLQVVLIVVLGFAAGFALYQGNFVTSTVHDELLAQKISFPPASQIKLGGALDPTVYPTEIRDLAGQPVDNGDKARVYANDFIGHHLEGVASGLTYSEVSSLANAHPTNAVLQGQVATLFKGEMLRASLLNSYGWWETGVYATYAGYGLLIAALAVLGALVYELFMIGRKPQAIKVAQKLAA